MVPLGVLHDDEVATAEPEITGLAIAVMVMVVSNVHPKLSIPVYL